MQHIGIHRHAGVAGANFYVFGQLAFPINTGKPRGHAVGFAVDSCARQAERCPGVIVVKHAFAHLCGSVARKSLEHLPHQWIGGMFVVSSSKRAAKRDNAAHRIRKATRDFSRINAAEALANQGNSLAALLVGPIKAQQRAIKLMGIANVAAM